MYLKDSLGQCPVTHLQDLKEFDLFYKFYKNLNAKKVIEIGSFAGATLWAWIYGSYDLVSLTSVDLSIGPGDGRYEMVMDSKRQWEDWVNNVNNWLEGYPAKRGQLELNTIEGNSMDQTIIRKVHDLYPNKDVDMLFIDGGHMYHEALSDYVNYQDLVKPGGWIVFHDTYGYPELRKLFDEIKKNGLHFEIYNPGGWGISVLIKQ